MSFKFLCKLFYDKMIIIVRSTVKRYRNYFRYNTLWILYALRSTSYDSCCSFVRNFSFSFLKLFISIECSFKYSQNFGMQSLSLYTSCLFSVLLNDDIVDTEKIDGICLPTYVVDQFSGFLLHLPIFSIKNSRSA